MSAEPSEPEFFLLSGAGNDFLAFAEPEDDPAPDDIRAWCRRGLSVGADGCFVLRRTAGAVEMRYFNADGGSADLCLNGARCAAELALHLGWAQEQVSLLTGAGAMTGRRASGSGILLELPPPAELPRRCALELGDETHEGWRVTVGVPHLVLLWPESLARAPVAELGPALRHHPDLGAAGANVDFARFPAPGRMELRTFERGVEAETLACGTGVLAAALTGLAAGVARLPLTAVTAGGFELTVAGEPETGRPRCWSLAGDARIVACGQLSPAAGALPPPPRWSG